MCKKILSLFLAGAMSVALIACGGGADQQAQEPAGESGGQTEQQAGEDQQAQGDQQSGSIQGTGETLTVYSNSVSDGRGEWLQERAAKDGFDIQFVDLGAADIQSRLIAEKSAPMADVAFGLNDILWASLKSEDILEPYVPAWAGEVPATLNDPDGNYHAIVKQAILLCYNQDKISAEEAPTDWTDLWTNEAFEGKYEYNTGLGGGTTRIVLAGILTRYADPNGDLGISDEGWEAIAAYYQKGSPTEEGLDLYARMADPENPIVCGQMWSSGIEDRDQQYGVNTAYAVPEVGVPWAVEGVAIIKGTKKLDEAKRFVDWFGSAQIQGEWAETFSTLPANENALEKANAFSQEIAELPVQEVDWDLVAANIDAWCEKIMLEYMQ